MTQHNVNVSCWGKKDYPTWSLAFKSVKRQYNTRKDGKEDRTVYRCRICHHWHVGGGKERD